jgi:LysR family transcriptional regulator, hydrogen peroxide-inducible genes activator
MTLQQLRYIVTLDKERHFARAAELCSVTQPGLTIQLKNLEEEIGIRIFDRSRVPLKPTALGAEIIEKAKKVLREIEGIRDLVIEKKNTLEGTVRLGVVSTLSPYLVPLFMKALERATPKTEYVVSESPTLKLIKDLETGEIDVALMATPTGNANLKEFPIFNEPFVACLHASHPDVKKESYKLNNDDKLGLLLLKQEYCYNAQLLDICSISKKKAKEQFTYDINSIETLKNMVRADLGFAIVPWLSIQNEPSAFYKSFKDPQPVREISLVVSDTFSKKLLLEKIADVIWNSLPKQLKMNIKAKKIKWNDSPYFIKAAASAKL